MALTEEGALAFTYAEEVFGLGQEMLGALKGATVIAKRVSVGLTDAIPKLVAHQILAPTPEQVPKKNFHRTICRGENG
ncbi:MAG: hypothetical protein R3F31_17970 [Verrucomicrobiales bacterium]